MRALCIVAFLIVSYADGDRQSVSVGASTLFAAARVTGQYSRLGAMLDPVLDRLLVSAGVVVCWDQHLLPRWPMAILLARELLMLAVGQLWVRRGLDLRINWPGRIAVLPTMGGLFFGLIGQRDLGTGCLIAGVALALLATALYLRSGIAQVRARTGVSSSA
jgi:cardiolipin synthase